MSLSKFLERPDIRARFREEFSKPKLRGKPDLLASPQSRRYGLVGTAFDYLLRFHIQRLNPDVVHHQWIAEAAVSRLGLREATAVPSDFKAEELLSGDETLECARGILRRAKFNHRRYMQIGKLTDALFRSAIGLRNLIRTFVQVTSMKVSAPQIPKILMT